MSTLVRHRHFTEADARQLAEIEAEIQQLENRMAVSHGLGDSHTAQGVSATFNNNPDWRRQLSYLRTRRNQLIAKRDCTPPPPPPGVNRTNYLPEGRIWPFGWGGDYFGP